MIKVSTTGMAVSLKTDLRFPISGQWGHGDRIIQEAQKKEIRAGIKEGLEGLKGQIPGMIDISVRTDYLPTSTVDVMLETTFEDADALAAYAKNPKHVAVADTRVRPFTANRACMDFEV
ncbi:MAG: Dabb family protein [Agathobacter rectalis]